MWVKYIMCNCIYALYVCMSLVTETTSVSLAVERVGVVFVIVFSYLVIVFVPIVIASLAYCSTACRNEPCVVSVTHTTFPIVTYD